MLITLLCTIAGRVVAQSYDDEIYSYNPIEGDSLLFRLPSNFSSDSYSDATMYYRTPTQLRRGVHYLTLNKLITPFEGDSRNLEVSEKSIIANLHSAYAQYRAGGTVRYNTTFDNGWNIASYFDFKTGRDATIDGLFRNEARSEISLSHEFEPNHFLSFDIELNYSIRSQQSASTQEAISLVGNNYYNPAWGFYNGEARSARVNTYATPSVDIIYQRPIGENHTLLLHSTTDIGEVKRGSLGYYDSYNPYPDYYSKLPSAMDYGYVRDYTTAIWKSGDSDYTQIAWNELEKYNTSSADGKAYYIVESRVRRYLESNILALLHSKPFDGVSIDWGVEANITNELNYKEVDDLLGAEYHLDIDYIFGDSYNQSTQMQNNLLNPNREVVEGDSFGYNYSLQSLELLGVVAITASLERFDMKSSVKIGSSSTTRTGNYNKERFSGSLSYGDSQAWSYTPIDARLSLGYSFGAKHYLQGSAIYLQQAPYSYDLFLDIEDCNILSSASPARVYDLSMSYRFSHKDFTLDCTIYSTLSRDGCDIAPHYDDILGVMTRAQTSNVATNSLGVEVVADWDISKDWSLKSTFAAASYRYASPAEVTLYSDTSLAVVADTSSALIDGLIVGNAPQLTASSSVTYRGLRHWILNLNASIAAMRYIEPSAIRRTERVYLCTANLLGDLESYSSQERLGDIYDLEFSMIRFFYLRNGDRLSLRLAIDNILGQDNRVSWARESHRLMSYDVNGETIWWKEQGSRYQYSYPRRIYFTLGYKF